MTTTQLLDWQTAVKHVFLTHWAICLDAFLSALMFVEFLSRHAGITLHAMKEINAQSFAFSADVAKLTVVDVFVWMAVVQTADATVIACKGDGTSDAFVGNWLLGAALHADDVLHFVSIHFVILFGVVAQPTDVDFPTAGRHQCTISLVMHTSQNAFLFVTEALNGDSR